MPTTDQRGEPATPTISVFTLFPELIEQHAKLSVIGRAQKSGLVTIDAYDLRSHAKGVHKSVDDSPYGGGAGMVLSPEPIFDAVNAQLEANKAVRPLFAMTAGGRKFDQGYAQELAQLAVQGGFSLICGRYEGFDERITSELCDGEISIGDFVLSGGEVGAMVVIEAVTRLIAGVMGNSESHVEESYTNGLLEYPQFTRPLNFRGSVVPSVLLSGDHAKVDRWRMVESMKRTAQRRPDLWAKFEKRSEYTKWFREFGEELPESDSHRDSH